MLGEEQSSGAASSSLNSLKEVGMTGSIYRPGLRLLLCPLAVTRPVKSPRLLQTGESCRKQMCTSHLFMLV